MKLFFQQYVPDVYRRAGEKEFCSVLGIEIAPGLMVHRFSHGKSWMVSHKGSGKRIGCGFHLRRHAVEAALKIAPLADWTLGEYQIQGVASSVADVWREMGDKRKRQ